LKREVYGILDTNNDSVSIIEQLLIIYGIPQLTRQIYIESYKYLLYKNNNDYYKRVISVILASNLDCKYIGHLEIPLQKELKYVNIDSDLSFLINSINVPPPPAPSRNDWIEFLRRDDNLSQIHRLVDNIKINLLEPFYASFNNNKHKVARIDNIIFAILKHISSLVHTLVNVMKDLNNQYVKINNMDFNKITEIYPYLVNYIVELNNKINFCINILYNVEIPETNKTLNNLFLFVNSLKIKTKNKFNKHINNLLLRYLTNIKNFTKNMLDLTISGIH